MNPNIARKRHAQSTQSHEGGDSHMHQSNGHSQHEKINVGEAERQASMIGGTVLAVCGLMRGSISGLALAAIGGALVYRGYTGHCEVYHMLGHSSAEGCEGKSCSEHSHEHGQATGQMSHQLS
jgi:hypothetical protein